MDFKGLALSFDAIMALIPVFLLLSIISGNNSTYEMISSTKIQHINQAQDALDLMANFKSPGEKSILEKFGRALENQTELNNITIIASEFLEKTIPGMGYKLVENSGTGELILLSKGEIENAADISVGYKNLGNHSFKLYVWKETN